MSTIHTYRPGFVLLTALCVSACVETRPSPFEPGGDGTGTVGTSGVGESGSEGAEESESGMPDPKLDVGTEPETPPSECASISQSTDIVDRPADIILIADSDIDPTLIQDQVTNLLPGMESDGVLDANVVLLFDGEPPAAVPGDDFECGGWACRGATQYGSVYAEVETSIVPGGILDAVLSTEDEWSLHMRAEAWKHIWITTSVTADDDFSVDEFRDELQTVLDTMEVEGSYFVHVFGATDGVLADGDGYTGLAMATDGHFEVGNLEFFEFQNAVVDRIKGAKLACEYTIPEPPVGLVFDRDKVNVIYDEGLGATPIGYVESAGDCQQFGFGWYYDDPQAPTEIRMCPLSCEKFEELANATIDIEFGCATIPAG